MKKLFVLAVLVCGFVLVMAITGTYAQSALRQTPTGQIERSPAQTAYLKRASGFTALHGAGAVVTLRDRNPSDSATVVHDYDLLLVVHQLMAAKAEAISINGTRIGSHTAIRVAGPTIMLGDHKLQPPFVIDVIGDGEWFAKIMKTSGLAKSFGESGPQMSVYVSNDVHVPALEEAPVFRFARPDNG